MGDFIPNKKSAGVYYTRENPFNYEAVKEWLIEALAGKTSLSVCEPYAGENSLLHFFESSFKEFLPEVKWSSFDITPPEVNRFPQSPVKQANTLLGLPETYDLIVSNPPYLAKNSARRQGLDYPFSYRGEGIASPVDLYQIALDTCLRSSGFCAMLIPESFLNSRYSKKRLKSVVSLPGTLFEDTGHPVCLALFTPDGSGSFIVYGSDGARLGSYVDLEATTNRLLGGLNEGLVFNDPSGEVGLRGVDNLEGESIRFVPGEDIDSLRVVPTSRALTRIHVPGLDDRGTFIDAANDLLTTWRKETADLFLTPFKGVRKDGKYRRRLSFHYAERILDRVLPGRLF